MGIRDEDFLETYLPWAQLAQKGLSALQSENPDIAPDLAELETFVNEAGLAIAAVEDSLRATAHPIELVATGGSGRDALLSTLVQSFGLALTLAFIAVVLDTCVPLISAPSGGSNPRCRCKLPRFNPR